MIERRSPAEYTVTLTGGNPHHVVYGRERGAYVGWCDCKGFEYRDDEGSPCAHLCALRKAEWSHNNLGNDPAAYDVQGEPIEAGDTSALAHTGANETEPELRTDGGLDRDVEQPAAGSDGREFGRPEARL